MSFKTAADRVEKAWKKLVEAKTQLVAAAGKKDLAQREYDEAYAAFNAQEASAGVIAPVVKESRKPMSAPKALKGGSKMDTTAEKPESERARRARQRAEYKRSRNLNDKGRPREKLTDDEFEKAKSDVGRFYEIGRNDTEIGKELNIKRALVTQIRKILGLKGKAEGRPKTKSIKDAASKKPKSKNRNAGKEKSKESLAVTTESVVGISVAEDLKSYFGAEQDLGEGRSGCPIISRIPEERFNLLKQSKQIEEVGAERKWFFVTKR